MKLRRILTVFVAVLLISLAAVINISADEGQLEIAVGVSSSTAISKDGLLYVESGDEIELTVSIISNPGLDSFQTNIIYDPELLTPVLNGKGELVVENKLMGDLNVSVVTDGEITFNRVSASNDSTTTGTGKATIKFIVNEATCKEIRFTLGTIHVLKAQENSIRPKELLTSANKQAIAESLAQNVFVNHNYELTGKTEPTCDEYGVNHYTCADCLATVDKTGDAPAGHTPVREDDKQTSCSEAGYLGATICSVCSEVLYDRVEIPMIEHHAEDVAGYAATCSATGLTDGEQCSVCDAWIVEQTEIPMIDHTSVDVNGIAATCTTDGLTDGKQCSVCDAWIVAQQTIPASHGELQVVSGVEATADADGLTDGKKCSVCGVMVEAQQVIPKLEGKSGCGSTLSAGAAIMVSIVLAGAVTIKKRKH